MEENPMVVAIRQRDGISLQREGDIVTLIQHSQGVEAQAITLLMQDIPEFVNALENFRRGGS